MRMGGILFTYHIQVALKNHCHDLLLARSSLPYYQYVPDMVFLCLKVMLLREFKQVCPDPSFVLRQPRYFANLLKISPKLPRLHLPQFTHSVLLL